MRFRVAAVSVLAIASLAACGSSGGSDSDGGNSGNTDNSTSVITNTGAAENTGSATGGAGGGGNGSAAAFCSKLEQASTKLGDLSSASSDPDKLKDALSKIVDYFKELDSNAPAEIEPTISDMTDALESAQKAVENNDPSGLSDLMSKMTTDAQKLSSYVTKNCTAG